MYEFVLYSRKGRTDGNFGSLAEAGRLDVVYQCILTTLFKAHSHRHDAKFHAILNGPPRPPLHLEVSGAKLRDARIDERTWEAILRKVLDGGPHPGITARKESLQSFIRSRSGSGAEIFVLEEKGDPVSTVDLGRPAVFVLGDHVGIPKNDERFVLRFGRKISLGRQRYLAATCIDVLNYILDDRTLSAGGMTR